MKMATFVSDYDPGVSLKIIRSDSGDFVLNIRGDGEMRIATDGGKLRGEALANVCEALNTLIETLERVEKEGE